MKYPLKWYHWFGREMKCFFLGHDVKVSWQRKKNYDELVEQDRQDIPYSERAGGKNPYFESVSWWRTKCIRCRMKSESDVSESFPIQLVRAIYYSKRDAMDWFGYITDEGIGFTKWPLAGLLSAVVFVKSISLYQENPRVWFIEMMLEVENWLYDKVKFEHE